jgi:hypothetical protein
MTIKPRAARAPRDVRTRLRDAPAADHSTAADGAPTAASALAGSATALTPLEQAIHDLVGRLDAIDPPRGPAARAALPVLGAPTAAPAARELTRRSPALPAGALAAGDLGREGIEVRLPEPAESSEPCVDVGERARVDGVDPPRALGAHGREPAIP